MQLQKSRESPWWKSTARVTGMHWIRVQTCKFRVKTRSKPHTLRTQTQLNRERRVGELVVEFVNPAAPQRLLCARWLDILRCRATNQLATRKCVERNCVALRRVITSLPRELVHLRRWTRACDGRRAAHCSPDWRPGRSSHLNMALVRAR